jgi:hypothetical protein
MHVRHSLALAVVVPLLLAGCTDAAEPTPKLPDPTTSSSTPTPTESETPEAESAEDFIRRWQAAADAMVLSGETRNFLELSDRCRACATYAEQVADVYAKGGKVEFGGSKVVDVKEESGKPPTYIVEVDAPRLRILVPNEQPRTFPAATQRYRMTLGREQDGFVMRHYAVI